MSQDFPKGELFSDDGLAPVTAESVRYLHQLHDITNYVFFDTSQRRKSELAASGEMVSETGRNRTGNA